MVDLSLIDIIINAPKFVLLTLFQIRSSSSKLKPDNKITRSMQPDRVSCDIIMLWKNN